LNRKKSFRDSLKGHLGAEFEPTDRKRSES
jgi:hypothetical protein